MTFNACNCNINTTYAWSCYLDDVNLQLTCSQPVKPATHAQRNKIKNNKWCNEIKCSMRWPGKTFSLYCFIVGSTTKNTCLAVICRWIVHAQPQTRLCTMCPKSFQWDNCSSKYGEMLHAGIGSNRIWFDYIDVHHSTSYLTCSTRTAVNLVAVNRLSMTHLYLPIHDGRCKFAPHMSFMYVAWANKCNNICYRWTL